MVTVTVIWAGAAEVTITDGAGDAAITTAGRAAIIVTTTDIPRRPPRRPPYRPAARLDGVKTNGVHDAWANRVHARNRRYAGRLFGGIALAD